jgi:hypothetical protein
VVQAGAELADPPVYSRIIADRLVGPAPSQTILQFQTVLDHYITPPIANAANLSLGLDLGISSEMRAKPLYGAGFDIQPGDYDDAKGPGRWFGDYDGKNAGPFPNFYDLSTFMPYSNVIKMSGWSGNALVGRALVKLPTHGTSVLVQHSNGPLVTFVHGSTSYPGYAFQDGHENVFQSLKPKKQYQCFLETSMPRTISGGKLVPARTLPGSPIVPDTRADNNDFLTCCDHYPTVAGSGLIANCSCCAATVCAATGLRTDSGSPLVPGLPYSSCCDTSRAGAWGPSCVAMARSGVCAACGPNDN